MSASDRTPEAADARHAELKGDESVIPMGDYCYTVTGFTPASEGKPPRMQIKHCPYWAMNGHQDGYCAKLKCSDSDPNGTLLLFDQTKECGINEHTEEEDDAQAAKHLAMLDAAKNS
jgi:hypothetical protein